MALIMREFTTEQRLIDIMRRCFACVELCVFVLWRAAWVVDDLGCSL